MNYLMASWGSFVRCGDIPILLAQGTDTPAGQRVMFFILLVGVIVPLVIGLATVIAIILIIRRKR